ncbi:hypothetical protein [Macrococcus capreoli]|uniref:hypothetical protein n=1 Tax=Macrococcus capreoli TaxID=2982690 RepID=UPI0021D56BE2|nr:hypothetical protein [Macrococcus sp. TMW 2.2395]MCU7557242.1 hypothetical protein [Macrococcus sp. TMW 2.2395]
MAKTEDYPCKFMRNEIIKLLESDIPGNEIEDKTGVSRAIISRLRLGQRDIGKLRLETAEKLCKYQEELEKNKK